MVREMYNRFSCTCKMQPLPLKYVSEQYIQCTAKKGNTDTEKSKTKLFCGADGLYL